MPSTLRAQAVGACCAPFTGYTLRPSPLKHKTRCISHFKLGDEFLKYFSQHQQSIQNLHIEQCDPSLLTQKSLRSVSAHFYLPTHKCHIFEEFTKRLPFLVSLSLIFWGGWTQEVVEYWTQNKINYLDGHKTRAQSLHLSGCMPVSFTRAVPKLFDLSALTQLSLFDCNLWLLLENIALAPELTHLTHFECSTRDMITTEHVLQDFFRRNARLKHLRLSLCMLSHLRMRSPSRPADEEILARGVLIWPLRGKLRTLSWHDCQPTQATEGPFDDDQGYLPRQSLDWICRDFPHLQQVGFKAPERLISRKTGSSLRCNSLRHYFVRLNDLRLVHLYQDRAKPVQPEFARSTDKVVTDLQQFATMFFQQTHKNSPRLDVLIWGMHGEATELDKEIARELGDGSFEIIPQIFFVKRRSQEESGAFVINASITTRSRLRDEFPDLDMLAHDPRFRELDRQMARV
ncbi:hypothetical protein EK21DRAFT_61906 [Setomelanomma holmii]|uniref:Uncharacterized protein n=1 Tax=Setomelanomma holmii TaxID=210430 RepID=A0A9P4HDF0_9PLEO|nr:hypothetical protein EK21DRAFT_61906 [Setomelanomma holmii]